MKLWLNVAEGAEYAGVRRDMRDESITSASALLGGEAGLRAGEIVALEWADVDLERRQIRGISAAAAWCAPTIAHR